MGNFTSVDLQKFQDRGLISSFEMKDGWLTLRGSGNSNCSEMRDIISLHLGFEPNAADVWRQGKNISEW